MEYRRNPTTNYRRTTQHSMADAEAEEGIIGNMFRRFCTGIRSWGGYCINLNDLLIRLEDVGRVEGQGNKRVLAG